MFRGSILLASHARPQLAVTLVQSVRPTVTIAGFPLSAWAFALRIWAAMMVGLYAAFWLQLESASSAAVTVGILALQTRGQAYQKAVYRVLATIVGVVASFVIAGLFPQSRGLFMIGFAGWLGLCVYVGGLLDGNRAYGAVLSGYTVAQVAVTQIDSPQNIFSAGVNRGAAIVVGIAALALVSDAFAAPNVHTGLSEKLTAAHRRVRAFALAVVRGGSADPIQSANLLREITALHPDITALVAESSGGGARGAAARSAAVALVAELSAAGALASLPAATLPSLRRVLGEALGEESRALQLRLQQHADVGDADPHDALFVRHAVDLLIENRRAQDAIEDLQAGGQSRRLDDEALFRDADRIGQLAGLQPADSDERRDDLREALDIFGRGSAVRRVRTTLAELSARTGGRLVGDGYSALAACDPLGLRRAAADLASTATQLDRDGQAAARVASLDLIWAAFLIDASPFGLDPHRSTSS
jgi:uncharacterized membrane protein YccC